MNAAQVQEGDQPAEEPQALLLELDRMTQELQSLITRINLTNSNSMLDGKTVTGLLAQRDMLGRKAGILRDLANTAGQLVRRVRGSEIKIISTVNVA
ncbi:DIP1984 family protein, partial [Escherichia coli]